MNRYWNTFKMYRSRYWPISDNTDHTGVYQTFRPEKRNSAGIKTKRKNRRNAWFEQTLVHQVATTLTSPIRSSSSFFFFFFFSSVVLLHCSNFFSFLLNNEHYVVSLSLFCISFEISEALYTWLALEMLKTYFFFNKIWAEWFNLCFFFSFEPPRYVMH